jgi:acetoin utilization deacetylase AcuC-like enzyme
MNNKITPFAITWHPDQENYDLAEMHEAMAQRYSRTVAHLVAEATGHFVVLDQFARDLNAAAEIAYTYHDREYVRRLVVDHTNENWFGPNVTLSRLALQSLSATVAAAREIIGGTHSLVYSVAAGQHHARIDRGAGFCALNDIVAAAHEFRAAGLKPIIIDIDIHAGDGTQAMLWESDIPTVSVHIGMTYPYHDEMMTDPDRIAERHTRHWPENHAYNFVLEEYAGDDALGWAADGIDDIIRREKPDVVIFVAGADGHEGTHESELMDTGFGSYTYAGFDAFASRVRGWADELTDGRILMTGAGGYQGLDHTPRIWANVVQALAGLR